MAAKEAFGILFNAKGMAATASNKKNPCVNAESLVLAPASILAAPRTITAVIGIAPRTPQATVDNPAAGPDNASCEPLIKETTMPPMIPERMPEYNGAPEASAIPKQSGSATKKTERSAGKSYFIQMSR